MVSMENVFLHFQRKKNLLQRLTNFFKQFYGDFKTINIYSFVQNLHFNFQKLQK